MIDADLLHESFLALQEAFRQSRDLVLANVGKQASGFKHDNTPVTETDTAVEVFITKYLQEKFPNLPVLGEEGGYDDQNLPETCWLIDPIDGTKSYIRNIPAFTGMAVLLHEGTAQASIIYDYSTNDMYVAEAGKGTYKNGQRIDLHNVPMPKKIFCKDRIASQLTELFMPIGFELEYAASGAGFGFLQVVDGISAGRFHLFSGPHIHDHAPGALLIKEAGGEVIPVLDPVYSLRTRSFVACHPAFAATVYKNLSEIKQIEDPTQGLI